MKSPGRSENIHFNCIQNVIFFFVIFLQVSKLYVSPALQQVPSITDSSSDA